MNAAPVREADWPWPIIVASLLAIVLSIAAIGVITVTAFMGTTAKDARKACADHGGVTQVATSIYLRNRLLVVCRDGSVHKS